MLKQGGDNTKIVVLLSGGIDSSTVAAMLSKNHLVKGFFIDYGQLTTPAELRAARDVCKHLNIRFKQFTFDLSRLVDSSLFGTSDDPVVPGRNAVLISLAVAYAQSEGFDAVAIGARADSRYFDQSIVFVTAMDKIMFGCYGVHVMSPILLKSKEQVVKDAERLGVLPLTYSCWYENEPCGKCKKCLDRMELLGHL